MADAPRRFDSNTPFPDLDKCHDALRQHSTEPWIPGSSANAPKRGQGLVTVSGDYAHEKVRIFHKTGSGWAHVSGDRVFRAWSSGPAWSSASTPGMSAGPNGWDGRVRVHLNVTDTGESAARQRAAPCRARPDTPPPAGADGRVRCRRRPPLQRHQTVYRVCGKVHTAEAGVAAPVIKFKTGNRPLGAGHLRGPATRACPARTAPWCSASSSRAARSRGSGSGGRAVAPHPAVINGVVYNNGRYLAPNPWGPPSLTALIFWPLLPAGSYAKLGFNITYMDDWFDHTTKRLARLTAAPM